MGYKVKWVEENLGVSRKALRIFEKEGLMPKNQNRQYRDYSNDDIERIWNIRLLQGIGYTLKEIAELEKQITNDDWDIYDSISAKINELEIQKIKIEQHLGYAKTIKLTGRIPNMPKKLGSIPFDEFFKNTVEEWNINKDPQLQHAQEFINTVLTQPIEENQDIDLGPLLTLLESFNLSETNMDFIMNETILPKAILKRKTLGPDNSEVQLLVKLMYENQTENIAELKSMTKQEFARYQSAAYLVGDLSKIKEREIGKNGCKFIADAIAIFGGFIDSNDPTLL